MADSYLTSADVLNFNRVDLDVLVTDVLDSTPFLQKVAARTAASDNFKYTKLLTNPSVGYRAVNDGVENTDATYSQISIDLKYLDASFAVDIAAAKVDAVCSSGTAFQTFDIRFVASLGYPVTGSFT